jgi:arylsulfatase A-like enzyme
MCNKKIFLKQFRKIGTVVFMICLFVIKMNAQNKSSLPNIIYILADDLGYGDVFVNNSESKINTPNIDKLAAQGMRFTDAHTTSSVCTPSRYSIMTGSYPWRSRLPIGVLRGYSRTLINPQQQTITNLLKTKTYHTGVVGKWHLGVDWVLKEAFKDSIHPNYNKDNMYGIRDEMNPNQINFDQAPTAGPLSQGFDYSYILPASLDMPPYCYLENDQLTELPTGFTPGNKLESGYTGPFWRPGLMSPSFDFVNVLPTFTNKAVAFIQNQNKSTNPYFLYFPMPAPHTPWMPTDKYKGKSKAGEYGDYVMMVDDAVGAILKVLDSLGMSQNTLVLFASDNGPYWRENFVAEFNHKSAGEFRGMKGDAFEGGHRVPFIVRYPGIVKAGTVSNAPTTLANLMATCAELIGNTSPEFNTADSYSILPILTGKATIVKDQPAIINISSKGFLNIKKDNWKLITKLGSGGFSAPVEITPKSGEPMGQLYNLATDISEQHNVYNEYPAKVKELTELLEKIKSTPANQKIKIQK